MQANAFVLFGGILLAGLVGGRLAQRTGFLPRITGFIFIGFLLGPSALGLLDDAMLSQARAFVDVALAVILFQLGVRMDVRLLARDRLLLVTAAAESAAAFLLAYAALRWLGVGTLHAALAAALGISSSPAVIVLTTRELGADGPVTRRALDLVALNNVVAFFVYTALLPLLHYEQQASRSTMLLQPLWRCLGAVTVAYAVARAMLAIGRALGRSASNQFALIVGGIVFTLGASKMLDVSSLLAVLALGVLARNLDRDHSLMEVEFGHGGDVFFVVLFAVAGASLHLGELSTVGWAAVAFVAARFLGKSAAVFAVSRCNGLTAGQSGALGLTLLPMAGMAIGLTQTTARLYPEFGAGLSAIVLAAVAILETLGPVATVLALKKAGEVTAGQNPEH